MAAAAWVLLLVVAAAALVPAEGSAAAAEAANAVLRAHQLPGGLLPRWITAFRHDAATGRFEAELQAPCIARFEVDLRYNATVAGVISRGQIAAISGVAAKDLFMWFRVEDIRIDDSSAGVIIFNVGVVKKHFPRAVFDAPPPCTPDPPALLRTTPQRLEDADGLLMGGAAAGGRRRIAHGRRRDAMMGRTIRRRRRARTTRSAVLRGDDRPPPPSRPPTGFCAHR